MEKNNEIFNETVGSLFKGMDSFLSTKTVVGEAIHIGDTILLPLVDVTFGVAAGAFRSTDSRRNNSGGGMGAEKCPQRGSVYHFTDGTTRMISVDNNRGIEKILDMIPDFVDKFAAGMNGRSQDEEAREKAAQEMEDMIDDAVNPAAVMEDKNAYTEEKSVYAFSYVL